MTIKGMLAQNDWTGRINFMIESRDLDHVAAKMPVTDDGRNPFGTMHAGALIWFADIVAALCAVGDLNTVDDQGTGFPLAIDLHIVSVANESDGVLTAVATTTKRGKSLS